MTTLKNIMKPKTKYNDLKLSMIQFILNDSKELSNENEMPEAIQEMGNKAFRDELTGLANQAYFTQRLNQEINIALKTNSFCSVIKFNLDNFQKINDEYGKVIGDYILQKIAPLIGGKVSTLEGLIMQKNVYARLEGDNFAAILPGASINGAILTAERIRSALENYYCIHNGRSLPARITASLGVTTFPQRGNTEIEVLDAADQALQYAKSTGKNKVEIFQP
jgi:diguanylate cyclase (GGDEF)-like protein